MSPHDVATTGELVPKVVIYGANGFVGRALVRLAEARGHEVRAIVRKLSPLLQGIDTVAEADPNCLNRHLEGFDWFINCAGRAHVMGKEDAQTALARFREVNVALTIALAHQAKISGIRHFAQISSVAAIRSFSYPGETITDATNPSPETPYGLSKLEADTILAEISDQSMLTVCLRPPVILGPQPVGLVKKLAWAAKRGAPLPLRGISNRRSIIAVSNLADAVLRSLDAGLEGNYIVTDSEPQGVADLYGSFLRAAGYSNRSFAVPDYLLKFAARLAVGERKDSLFGDAAYSGLNFQRTCNWAPPVRFADAVEEMMVQL